MAAPTLTVIYTTKSLLIDAAGHVPAEGRADASVVVRWTSDATLLFPAPRWPREVDGIPITDPVQQWWDLLDLGGEDRAEAADRLRRALLDQSPAMSPSRGATSRSERPSPTDS